MWRRLVLWWRAWISDGEWWAVIYKDGKNTRALRHREATALAAIFGGQVVPFDDPQLKNNVVVVQIEEQCFVCGNDMELRSTVTPQKCPCGVSTCTHEAAWWANDGDDVVCVGCGAKAWVSVDCEEAYVAWDETTPHNVKCAEKYEASR